MKNIKIIFVLFILVMLSSCSVQEKASPEIVVKRLKAGYSEFVFENDGFYSDGNYYIFFNFKNTTALIKMETDKNNSVARISVSFESDDNNDVVFDLIEPLITVYSLKEDCTEIIKSLSCEKDGFSYAYGHDHIYSLVRNGKNIYFEIINNRLSEYSAPQLTLKQNDRENF